MQDIYIDTIIEHYRRPRNYGKMEKPDSSAKAQNIFCGDFVKMYVKFQDKKIQEVSFQGKGCVISQAASSIIADYVKNKQVAMVREMSIEDVVRILGINLSPTRMKCAELPLLALKKALNIVKQKYVF